MACTKCSWFKYLPLVGLLFFVIACRYLPHWADGYMKWVYPTLSAWLSGLASVVPYSLEEWLVVGVIAAALLYPVVARCSKWFRHTWLCIAKNYLLGTAWLYVWFYLGWGMSYYRSSIYERLEVEPSEYSEKRFTTYLDGYVEELNQLYTDQFDFDTEELEAGVKEFYSGVGKEVGLAVPKSYQHPKSLLFNGLYSSVGVLGYMGPFFVETQLNEELLAVQYPFSYAHEYAHLLGISSEAEANFWAFQACKASNRVDVRYSGYFGLLPYVLSNAATLLSEDRFKALIAAIRPEVLEQARAKSSYWSERYSPLVGQVQSWLYNQFLKGNKIASGRKNYAEVVGLLIDLEAYALSDKPVF